MSGFQISALDASILMIQRPKSLKITRENDWAHFQAGLWPLRPGKRPLGIFWDSAIPNFAHKSAKNCPIFKFLDNFSHYSSSPTFSVCLLWPPEGVISMFWPILIRGPLGPSGEKTATCPRLERASKVGIFFKLSFEVLQVKIFRGSLCQITKNVIFTFLTVSQLFVYIFSKFLLAAYSTFSGQYFMCTHFLLSSSQFCSRAIFSFELEKAAILNFCLSSAMELSRDPKMYQNGPCPLGISKIYTILTNSKTLGQWILPNVS